MKNFLKNKIQSIIETDKIQAKKKVIDIGCADVRPYSEYLINQFDYYVGVDIDTYCLNKAKKRTF